MNAFDFSCPCFELSQLASPTTHTPLCKKRPLSFPSVLGNSATLGSSQTSLPCPAFCNCLLSPNYPLTTPFSFPATAKLLKFQLSSSYFSVPICGPPSRDCPPKGQLSFSWSIPLCLPRSDSIKTSSKQAFAALYAKKRYMYPDRYFPPQIFQSPFLNIFPGLLVSL